MSSIETMLDRVYEANEGSEILETYLRRHEIQSLGVLTVYSDETAGLIASFLEDRIAGKTVVEIGGGIGLLAFHLGMYAKKVYCIEANPNWSWTFAAVLMAQKPKNVSYLFGAADEFAGQFRADIAIFCTHSGTESMRSAGSLFAPEVIDVYGELLPQHKIVRSLTAR